MIDCKCGNSLRCELLAPAGSYETMLVAFNAGADAVYVGGQKFGARAFAGNFNEEELVRAINYAHMFDKKLYLTVNTLIKEEEFSQLYDYIKPYYEAGLDAVIVQDIGVLKFIAGNFTDLPIHCSTQMTITGEEFGKVLAENKSVTRIVTPRELNLAEIKKMYTVTGLEIESFVHGALCYCYSGQCLLSSIIGARSGNRGRCAQPCRLTFSNAEQKVDNKHLLSPKDLCTLEILPEIIETGVYSLKIEGRMKKPEYVASVVAIYRKYIDRYLKNGKKNYKVIQEDIDTLKDIYNRGGFTDGFYKRQNGSEMMTINRPNHCGVKVGNVLDINQNIIKIQTVRDIKKGDILEIDSDTEFFAPYDIRKGEIFDYKFKQKIRFGNVKEVIRTRNEALINTLLNNYMYDEKGKIRLLKRRVNIDIIILKDKNIEAAMWDNIFSVTTNGNVPLEAKNKPITKDFVVKQLGKLGETCFAADSINVQLDEGLFVTVSELNEIRRSLVELLTKEIKETYRRYVDNRVNKDNGLNIADSLNKDNSLNTNTAYKTIEKSYSDFSNNITVLVSDMKQFEKVISIYRGNRIYLEYAQFSLEEIASAVKMGNEKNVEIFIALPYILRANAKAMLEKEIDALREIEPSGYLFRNLESFFYLKNKGINIKKVIFDSNIYAFNNETIKYYKSIGADIITASYETNGNEFKLLDKSFMEINVYGYFPVMLTAGCVRKTMNKCLKTLLSADEACKLKSKDTTIVDRKSSSFTVRTVCRYCYNIIYNSVPIGLFQNIDELEALGFCGYRISFTTESPEEIENILLNYKNLKSNYTKGHFKRGVE
jgi:putative protease